MKTSLKRMTTIVALAVAVLSVAAPAAAQLRTAVTILHAVPGLSVDLVVDGQVIIAGFNAGDTQDLSSLAGQTLLNIEAREPGGGEVVIGPIESFDVPAEGNASVVLHLDGAGGPLITSFFNDPPPTDQGFGRLVVRHVAAAPTIAVTIDDVELLADIDNGREDGADLPAGMIDNAWITAGGERIAQVPNLELDANSNLILYVGGSAADGSLAFFLQVVAAGQVEAVDMPVDDGTTVQIPAADGTPVDDVATDETPVDQVPVGEMSTGDDDEVVEGDGTPQPEMVNTGSLIDADRNVVWLAGAIGAGLLAVGAFGLRRRTT